MISGTFVAMSVLKLAAMGTFSMAVIAGVKTFNTFDFKRKKKGGSFGGNDEIKSLRERIGSRG